MSEQPPVELQLQRACDRRHILGAVAMAAERWADVLDAVAASPSADEAAGSLQRRFGLDEAQASAILDVQVRRVARAERQRVVDELTRLDHEIAQLERAL